MPLFLNKLRWGREGRRVLGDNKAGQCLSPFFIVQAQRPRVLDTGHVLQSILDSDRRNVESSGNDHVVGAPQNFQAPTGVDYAGIPADKPTGTGLVVEWGVADKVARQQNGAGDSDTGGALPIEGTDHDSGKRDSVIYAAATGFGHSKGFDDGESCILGTLAQRGIKTGAADQDGVEARQGAHDFIARVQAINQLGGN